MKKNDAGIVTPASNDYESILTIQGERRQYNPKSLFQHKSSLPPVVSMSVFQALPHREYLETAGPVFLLFQDYGG